MVDKGFKSEVIAVTLQLFDVLTVIDREDIKKRKEYIRESALEEKSIKRSNKKLFEEYLDNYFIKTWSEEKLIDMFNYNDGDNWRSDMGV
jgi:hypothetical protein